VNPAPPRIAERPNIAGPIIDKFGGDDRCAELTGYPIARIRGWRRVGQIHDKYRPFLLHIAAVNGVPHTPWDYIAHLAPYSIAA
jgi:hypothetical protein